MDVMCKSIIDKYIDWPKSLQDICLAIFVANYNHIKNKISIRRKPKIIRFVHYNQFKDLENWSREQLLLYVPFIDVEEFQKINKDTWKATYDEQVGNVLERKKEIFNFQIQATDHDDDWINLEDYAFNLASSKDFNIWNDLSIGDLESMPISMNQERYDLATNIIIRSCINNTYKSITIDNNCILQVMKNEEYISMLRLLNEEQRAIYDDIMYKKRVHFDEPIYLFLTGGARTGKTFTLQAIVQGLLRMHHKNIKSDP